MSGRTRHLRIATGLLGASDGPAWSNLGCWDDDSLRRLDYPAACCALARAHGDAAQLAPGQHVLDLGCGHGASLAFWPTAYDINGITALERQPDCVAALQRLALPGVNVLPAARFDTLPLPTGLAPARCDAAVCVDAAYHARSLAAFAACAAAAVRPGGRLAFSTLVATPALASASPLRRALLRQRLALAGIPAASLHDDDSLRATLAAAGWQDIEGQTLDSVLSGFAAYAGQRGRQLTRRQRLTPGWLKIALTGRLCASLAAGGLVSYRLISARRGR